MFNWREEPQELPIPVAVTDPMDPSLPEEMTDSSSLPSDPELSSSHKFQRFLEKKREIAVQKEQEIQDRETQNFFKQPGKMKAFIQDNLSGDSVALKEKQKHLISSIKELNISNKAILESNRNTQGINESSLSQDEFIQNLELIRAYNKEINLVDQDISQSMQQEYKWISDLFDQSKSYLRKSNDALQKKVEIFEKNKSSKEKRISQNEEEIVFQKEKYDENEKELFKKLEDIENLKNQERKEFEKAIDGQSEEIKENNKEIREILDFSSEKFGKKEVCIAEIDQINRHISAIIKDFQKELDSLNDKAADIKELKDLTDAKKRTLRNKEASSSTEIQKIEGKIHNKQKLIDSSYDIFKFIDQEINKIRTEPTETDGEEAINAKIREIHDSLHSEKSIERKSTRELDIAKEEHQRLYHELLRNDNKISSLLLEKQNAVTSKRFSEASKLNAQINEFKEEQVIIRQKMLETEEVIAQNEKTTAQ